MKEADIRPKQIWDKYKSLAEKDCKRLFHNCQKSSIPCVACESTSSKDMFEKDGFSYQTCSNCGTIYLCPRPDRKYFDEFYIDGESVKFWSTHFYPLVEEIRREKIYSPRAKQIKEKLYDFLSPDFRLVDIGCGYGTFLEEVRDQGLDPHPHGIEPNPGLANVSRNKGFEIHECLLENLRGYDNSYDIAIAFEVLEHLYNPLDFISKAHDLLKPNGVLLMTTLSCRGYDFQLLGKDHDNLKPPHHINFFNPKSAEMIFTKCGFTKIEIETPGKLDVDILCNRVEDHPRLLEDKFFQIIYNGNEDLKAAFQDFLASNNLSSHMWIWAYKGTQ